MNNPIPQIIVVIPCYKVKGFVLDVLAKIGPEVNKIICVDDKCPEESGSYIETVCRDPRVSVLFNPQNLGVGGATIEGYKEALKSSPSIIVKIDGDGQMDPALTPQFVKPIVAGRADYTKGNRFFKLESLSSMPLIRLLGNTLLSFFTKLSTGYWHTFDPTNGYTAIESSVLNEIQLDKISKRYFFESDLLFRLNIMGAIVEDVPMESSYGEEESNLHPGCLIPEFAWKHLRNYTKRLIYNYYLRNFSIASVELLLGIILLFFGGIFGAAMWRKSITSGIPVTAGTVMLAGLPVIVGFQLFLSFINYDTTNTPRTPLHKRL